jgi:hypothetical protein
VCCVKLMLSDWYIVTTFLFSMVCVDLGVHITRRVICSWHPNSLSAEADHHHQGIQGGGVGDLHWAYRCVYTTCMLSIDNISDNIIKNIIDNGKHMKVIIV